MAGELSEAFEQHLRSLSDSEWEALSSRVRTKAPPPDTYAQQQKRADEIETGKRRFKNAGQEEAYRRGFIDQDGRPTHGGNNR
ncbi:hypothetical protein A5699_02085 [Mycobacterium sp. E802]|uniref:hypothetical protein n=1 Tax=Mycobacterium sp. E802 TaxID=1834152 RepID=UPI0008011E17|nr:hypothetical protein [Mycobacterium sp. E802]OBG87538.1 hypothetical protein A5699_02085 [Mycobacterium sp. E802]